MQWNFSCCCISREMLFHKHSWKSCFCTHVEENVAEAEALRMFVLRLELFKGCLKAASSVKLRKMWSLVKMLLDFRYISMFNMFRTQREFTTTLLTTFLQSVWLFLFISAVFRSNLSRLSFVILLSFVFDFNIMQKCISVLIKIYLNLCLNRSLYYVLWNFG